MYVFYFVTLYINSFTLKCWFCDLATWVPSTIYWPLPEGALLAGHDQDGSPMYVGRAWHEGDQIPGKVLPAKKACYISYGGNEILKDQYDVLCHGSISWVPYNPSSRGVPPFAITGGGTADGEPLFVGMYRINLKSKKNNWKCAHTHTHTKKQTKRFIFIEKRAKQVLTS